LGAFAPLVDFVSDEKAVFCCNENFASPRSKKRTKKTTREKTEQGKKEKQQIPFNLLKIIE